MLSHYDLIIQRVDPSKQRWVIPALIIRYTAPLIYTSYILLDPSLIGYVYFLLALL